MSQTGRKRRYTDDDRANALAALTANRGNVSHTAAQLGIPESTLRQWASGDRHPEAAGMAEARMGALADRLETVAHRIVNILPGKLAATPTQQLVVSLGIVIEKMLLLRGRPTSIDRTEGGDDDLRALTDDELFRRLAEAQRRREAVEAGSPGKPTGEG